MLVIWSSETQEEHVRSSSQCGSIWEELMKTESSSLSSPLCLGCSAATVSVYMYWLDIIGQDSRNGPSTWPTVHQSGKYNAVLTAGDIFQSTKLFLSFTEEKNLNLMKDYCGQELRCIKSTSHISIVFMWCPEDSAAT